MTLELAIAALTAGATIVFSHSAGVGHDCVLVSAEGEVLGDGNEARRHLLGEGLEVVSTTRDPYYVQTYRMSA